MYYEYNPNPVSRRVGDCAVRAVAKALDTDWETAYTLLVTNGFLMGDMPSSVLQTEWSRCRGIEKSNEK